ncbi:P-loop NTPase [Candidatus Neomarinimicrobiota bacterium]
MDRDAVLNVLKSVNYPGFSRDIVSFGMIDEIIIDGNSLKIQLAVASDNDEQKAKLSDLVTNALTEKFESAEIQVSVVQPKTNQNGPAAKTPGVTAVASPIPGIKYTIAVASGKGGVGKSTVSVNLAAALAATGVKVGILDLDIYGPSLPMIMGIEERPYVNEDQKIVPLERYGMKMMSFGFISGNQAPTIWRGPMVAKMTQQFFTDVAWGELDFLILDLPPGTGDIQLTLVQELSLTGAVIVTTPQQLALLDVRKGADMFAKVNTPVLGVVENMAGLNISGIVKDGTGAIIPGATIDFSGLGELSGVTADDAGMFNISVPIFRTGGGAEESTRLNVPLLGKIPLNPDLVLASDNGEPFVIGNPEHEITGEFQKIAAQLIKEVG